MDNNINYRNKTIDLNSDQGRSQMKINKSPLYRFFPLIIPLIVLSLYQAFFLKPQFIYVIIILINLAIFFTLWQFSKNSEVDKKWWNFLILPSFMTTSVIVYTIFLGNKMVIQLLFFAAAAFLYLYLRLVYYYLLKPNAYQVFSIENISSYGNFLTFFLLASIIYGLQSFLNISIWLLELIILILTAIIVYQIMWANKIDFKKGASFILICSLILLELSWTISFLPFNFNIAGISLAICYYILIGLISNYLLDKLETVKIKAYLGLGLGSLLLIAITSSWM